VSDLPPPPPPPDGSGFPSGPPTRPPADAWVPPGAVPPPPGTEEPTPPSRRWLWTVLGVIAVLALLAATVVVVTGDDEEPSAAPAPTTTAPQEPGTTTTTAPAEPLDEAELRALVDELQDYVAEARGLAYLRPVEVQLAEDDAFEARLLEKFEEDVEDIEEAEVFYRALGLIEPERSLVEELRAIYAAGVLGFYDPETDELLVRGAALSPYVRQTIVHELVHALDDQHFELFREEYDDREDEIGTGFTALVEGNARRVEQAWLDDQPADVREQAEAEEQAFAEGIDVDDFPEILLFEIGAPYELGEVFVGAVAADGEIVDQGVVGALFWFGLLTTGDAPVGAQDAFAAVQGWGGDWAVTWEDGDAACVRVDVVGDSPDDTTELEDALRAWAEESAAAQVSVVDGRVRLESCLAGAAGGNPQV